MRIIFAGAAAALFSFATATPAFAQFGGSPTQQVDGAPGQSAQAPATEDEDDQAVAPDDQATPYVPDEDGYGKPGADDNDGYAAADIDADVDAGDVDNDVEQADANGDMDQGDVDNDADQGDVDDDADQGDPGSGVVVAGNEAQPATWQGEDGRSYCRRSDGTTGLVVGGGAGALIGRGIDGGRHRSGGTIIGAIAGAIIGTAVEQSANRQSCR